MTYRILPLALSFFLSICMSMQVFGQANASMFMDVQLVSMGTGQRVEVSFEVDRLRGKPSPDGMLLKYKLQTVPDSSLISSDTVNFTEDGFEKVNQTFYFSFVVEPSNIRESLLSVWLEDTFNEEQIFRQLSFRKPESPVSFGLRNLSNPNRVSYIKTGDSITLNDTFTQPVYLIRFDQQFLPAAPPMATDFGANNPQMRVSRVLRQATNQPFVIDQEGLYFAQRDTTSNLGMGIRVVPEDYPKFSEMDNLGEAMIYISTNSEIQNMRASDSKKRVFENFWLNLGGSVENAQRMLRLYFQRVAYANKSFTSYKEGWKTDQGIVHIIFGRPDEIVPKSSGEQWVYMKGKNSKRVVFEFVKRENIFSKNHYEMLRSPRYKRIWYDQVQRWRKGTVR